MTYTVRKFGKAPLNIPTPQAADYPVDSTIDTAEALDNAETVIDTSADPTTALPAGTRILINSEYMTVSSASATDITVVRENPVTHLTGQDIYKMVAGRCVLWYPGQKDAYGSTIRDMSGYGNNGTLTGATWVKNSRGLWVLNFDGDDFVNCGNGVSLQITTRLTMLFWLNTTAVANWQRFIAKDDETNRCYIIILKNTNVVRFSFWVGNVEKLLDGTTAVNDGKWHLIAATYDGSTQAVYVDGVSDQTPAAVTGAIDNDTVNLNLGRSILPGSFFTGRMALVRIADYALTAPAIASAYRTERQLFGV